MIPVNLDWLETARLGGNVTRMHILPTITSHNVAEHTFHAAFITMELCAQNEIQSGDCVSYILAHDIAEGYTGDTPGNVKVDHPNLSGVLAAIETKWERDNFPYYLSERSLSEFEMKLVKSADLLELGYYCVEEREMGNTRVRGVFDNVLSYIASRELDAHVNGVAVIKARLVKRWMEAGSI